MKHDRLFHFLCAFAPLREILLRFEKTPHAKPQSRQVLSAFSASLCGLLLALAAPAQITNYPAGTKAVMVNTNGQMVAPDNFFAVNPLTNASMATALNANGKAITNASGFSTTSGVVGIVGGLVGMVPTWDSDVTNGVANDFLVYSDTADGKIAVLGDNKALIDSGLLGSASSNATAHFVRSTNGAVVGSFSATGTGTFAAVVGANVLYSRPGNAWPKTHRVVVSGGPATYGAAAGGGGAACYSISYGSAFPCGMYTNIRRMAAITLTYLTNATWNASAATNLSITLYGSAVAPSGGNWAFGTAWYPTNNGTWTFYSTGPTAYITATNVLMNVPVPLYNNGLPSAVFHPVVYVHNQGATPVTNVLVSVIYELDNGVED